MLSPCTPKGEAGQDSKTTGQSGSCNHFFVLRSHGNNNQLLSGNKKAAKLCLIKQTIKKIKYGYLIAY